MRCIFISVSFGQFSIPSTFANDGFMMNFFRTRSCIIKPFSLTLSLKKFSCKHAERVSATLICSQIIFPHQKMRRSYKFNHVCSVKINSIKFVPESIAVFFFWVYFLFFGFISLSGFFDDIFRHFLLIDEKLL